jgi:hypothetical protein
LEVSGFHYRTDIQYTVRYRYLYCVGTPTKRPVTKRPVTKRPVTKRPVTKGPDYRTSRFADLLPWFRIKMSMLLDLDKDYLKDMDITLMGDIINILKHARVVANRNTSEMVLSDKVW